MNANPSEKIKRSIIYREHINYSSNTIFAAINNGSIVNSYTDNEDEHKFISKLAIADLTLINRIGFKGVDTCNWLKSLNIDKPKKPNTAKLLADDTLVVRLSSNEFLFLDSLTHNAKTCNYLNDSWQFNKGFLCYKLLRDHSHSLFAVTGRYASNMLAKLCAVDLELSAFPIHNVAQTSVARLNSIVVRSSIGNEEMFYILSDSASALYMWNCLLDAMTEFSGKAVGIKALQYYCIE